MIPIEIVNKMEQVNSLMKEIDRWLYENIDPEGSRHDYTRYLGGYEHDNWYEFTDEPSGEEYDGDYCDSQPTEYSDDGYHGNNYHKTEKGNYFTYEFWI